MQISRMLLTDVGTAYLVVVVDGLRNRSMPTSGTEIRNLLLATKTTKPGNAFRRLTRLDVSDPH